MDFKEVVTSFKSQFLPYDQIVNLISEVQRAVGEFRTQAFSRLNQFSEEIQSFKAQEEESLRKARLELKRIRELKEKLEEQLEEVHRKMESVRKDTGTNKSLILTD